MYHQQCAQQNHVLTRLVSPEVHTQKSRFDLQALCCITNAHSKLMPQVICTFYESQKLCHPRMLAYHQQGLFVFVLRQSLKSAHRKTDLIQKCLYSVFLSFLSFIKSRNTIRDGVSKALYTIKTLLTLFKLFKLLQH